MMTSTSTELLSQFKQYYQTSIRDYLTDFETLSTMLGYQMGWNDAEGNPAKADGGKQLRPLITLLSCAALDGNPENALPLAAGIELIHTFSLIHDDVMDVSETRRGQPSVWNVWGVNQAINAGDGAYGLSFQMLADAKTEISAERRLQATMMLGKACVNTVQGQMMDIDFESRDTVGADEYVRMTGLKTGPLIGLALAGGALLANQPQEAVTQLDKIGRTLGVAFQMQDDILGVWGNPEETGKSTMDDLRQKKKALPMLWALENLPEDAKNKLQELNSQPAPLSIETINQQYEILSENNVRGVVEDMAQTEYNKVVDGITSIYPDNAYREEMLNIVAYIVQRNR